MSCEYRVSKDDDDVLSLFGNNYFSSITPSLSSSSWHRISEWLTSALGVQESLHRQSKLLHHILNQHPSRIFPCPSNFKREVGQWIVQVIEDAGLKADEGFKDLAQQPDIASDFHFKTYSPERALPLVLLEENRDPLSNGTTGLVSWQAAWMLSDWSDTFIDFLKDKNVLELGSGVGYFGLGLAMKKLARVVTLTDCNEHVLNFLKINAHINFQRESLKASEIQNWIHHPPTSGLGDVISSSVSSSEIRIRHLDWTSYDLADLPECDVIVGSDLVYCMNLVDPLVSVIKALLVSTRGRGQKNAFIACTHRNGEALDTFVKAIKRDTDLRVKLFMKRTFAPDDGVLALREPLRPVSLYQITTNVDMNDVQYRN